MTKDSPFFTQKLAQVFARFPAIGAVYLFGSVAESRAIAGESDLDLAIVLRRGHPTPNPLDIQAELIRAGFDRVDLVFLSGEDIVLAHEAVRLNRVIYAAEDFDWASYSSLVIRQYLDFLPYLQVQNQAYKERAQRDLG